MSTIEPDDRVICCPECRSVFEAEDDTLVDVEAIVAARLASVKAWFDALENIQRAYADIVMDTPEERETHRKLVVIADLGLREARAVLGSDAHAEQKGTGDA